MYEHNNTGLCPLYCTSCNSITNLLLLYNECNTTSDPFVLVPSQIRAEVGRVTIFLLRLKVVFKEKSERA